MPLPEPFLSSFSTMPRRTYAPAGKLTPETAQAFRTLMELRGMSGRRLAMEVGLTKSYVSKLRQGKARPSLPVADLICDSLTAPEEFRQLLRSEAVPDRGRYHEVYEGRLRMKATRDARLARDVRLREWAEFNADLYAAVKHSDPKRADEMEAQALVYIARIRDGAVKIGSSINPYRRTADLYADLICVLPGGRSFERQLHQRFAHLARPDIGREAFDPRDDLAEFIIANAGRGLE